VPSLLTRVCYEVNNESFTIIVELCLSKLDYLILKDLNSMDFPLAPLVEGL